ncbi:hypothetical protein [Deinococcus arenicola]|uniref:Lipoprotein n=1 Tax=Deinococcus arenicola TaxID=2994950 RepID=A0ABU4DUF1_9DEIO|nr:hypothetical protein [Deinococcus sp. ZS9-10]MDV6376018.1 hypothetical protein [Deinococcus sp. ZS9-10]
MKQNTILITLLALTLSACAPAAQLLQPDEKATLAVQGLSVLMTNPGPDALTGDKSVAGDGPALNVVGVNIKPDAVAAPWCEEVTLKAGVRWVCNLPEIPADANRPLRVTFVGDVGSETPQLMRADLAAYRASLGAKFVVLYSR